MIKKCKIFITFLVTEIGEAILEKYATNFMFIFHSNFRFSTFKIQWFIDFFAHAARSNLDLYFLKWYTKLSKTLSTHKCWFSGMKFWRQLKAVITTTFCNQKRRQNSALFIMPTATLAEASYFYHVLKILASF